ncbi:MAG: queuine tRNA-ribosyltransferase family protein, partial [Candidatus Wildermuthbacteria bacterium]|nr:queuine tRNA-ribosyltransferase family protein [Candidatus Wildermuthbacteria bacterium]
MGFFKVLHQSRKSKARIGIIHTPHGDIHTPSFVPVATKGTLKSIPPKDIKDIGVQVAFVNTFHLVMHPGADTVKRFGGIHAYSGLNIPLMSDSAGFQVFSLGKHVSINEKGVKFRLPVDGREVLFTPESSIRAQEKIGADILMAFDECIYHGATHEYTGDATARTHRWLIRCIETKKCSSQRLYGIVQGGMFKDLRTQSAKFVSRQDISGIAIGGVSVGETKKEMREQVSWVAPYLPKELPCHLLGI